MDQQQTVDMMMSGQRQTTDGSSLQATNMIYTSGFRVRSQVARRGTSVTKNYRLRKQVERLSVPKDEYIPKDPYKY